MFILFINYACHGSFYAILKLMKQISGAKQFSCIKELTYQHEFSYTAKRSTPFLSKLPIFTYQDKLRKWKIRG